MEDVPIMGLVRELEDKVRQKNKEISSWQRVAFLTTVASVQFWAGFAIGVGLVTVLTALVIFYRGRG